MISNRVILFEKNDNGSLIQMRVRVDKAGKVLDFATKNIGKQIHIKLNLLTTPITSILYDMIFLGYSLDEFNSESAKPLEAVLQFVTQGHVKGHVNKMYV